MDSEGPRPGSIALSFVHLLYRSDRDEVADASVVYSELTIREHHHLYNARCQGQHTLSYTVGHHTARMTKTFAASNIMYYNICGRAETSKHLCRHHVFLLRHLNISSCIKHGWILLLQQSFPGTECRSSAMSEAIL